MKLLSNRISQILKDHPDIDQAKLGSIAGASKSVVSQWLSGGIQSINIDYALKIEDALRYDHIWVMTGRGERFKSAADAACLDKRIEHAVKIMQEMEDYQLDQAVKIIDTFAQPAAPNGTTGVHSGTKKR